MKGNRISKEEIELKLEQIPERNKECGYSELFTAFERLNEKKQRIEGTYLGIRLASAYFTKWK